MRIQFIDAYLRDLATVSPCIRLIHFTKPMMTQFIDAYMGELAAMSQYIQATSLQLATAISCFKQIFLYTTLW